MLWGLSCQTHTDFDVIVGDDGSTAETAGLIERLRDETRLDIKHVWQKDEGFRKCRILNKALLHVTTDYVVFTDGDCILRRDFLSEHVRSAKQGYYVSGSYYKLPMATSNAIRKEDILTGRCFDVKWLRKNGLPRLRKTMKISASPWQARVLNAITTTRCNLKGSNASAWLEDILAVNGFDERMTYGGLDREFGVRLSNSGIRARHARFNAICVHLDHARGYRDPILVAENKALRLKTERERVTATPQGIQQLLDSGYTPDAKNPGTR